MSKLSPVGGGLFRQSGAVAVCRFCHRVHEGTASFAVEHARDCAARQIADIAIRAGVEPLTAAKGALRLLAAKFGGTP